MRICYIADGGSIHTKRWIGYFQKKGHTISLLTDCPGDIPDIEQHSIGNKNGNKLGHYYQCVRDIKNHLREFRPDILHGHFISGYGYWAQMSKFHPMVLTAWGSDIYITPNKKFISRLLTKSALESADLLTADSENLKSTIKELAPSSKRIEIINFGVDTNLFSPDSNNTIPEVQNNRTKEFIVLSNRRLEVIYNVENIIRAVSLVSRQVPNIRLIILGEGTLKKELIALTQSLGLKEKVEFPGEVTQMELVKYLRKSDVYVSVPTSDATSVSLLEAMACQKPVIVSDIPSNHEWVQTDINGKIVSPTSVDELSRALLEIMNQREKSKEFGIANRQIILERAEYNSQMGFMERLYQELL